MMVKNMNLKYFFKRIIKKIKLFYYNRSLNGKVKYLRKKGAHIGVGTRLLCRLESLGTEPYLISIGDDCLISSNVSFVTHDGGVKVLNALNFFDGIEMDNMARIYIGNNVYIGKGAMIMPGVKIGNNVVIGAYSVVTKDIPDNVVAAGIPARLIKDINKYYLDCKKKNRFYNLEGLSNLQKKEYLENNCL